MIGDSVEAARVIDYNFMNAESRQVIQMMFVPTFDHS